MTKRIERKLQVIASDPNHEEMFLQRYERLREWALLLTSGRRASAEDLLHDAFVQFMVGRPDLDAIANLDGYLRRMLKYLHLSQTRRATQMQDMPLNIADFDSAEIGLRTIDLHARLQTQETLLQICKYACARKDTSRAGSVLILRYFQDYSPGEIAKVIRSARRTVDEWLRLSRREAKVYLEDPLRLKFISNSMSNTSPFDQETNLAESVVDLMHKMRATIYRSRRGDCLSDGELHEIYGSTGETAPQQIPCLTLGHIASCPFCLDRVNRLLGLVPLSARHSTQRGESDSDHSDSDGPTAGNTGSLGGETDGNSAGLGSLDGGSAASSTEAFLNRGRAQVQRLIEHRPEELLLSVNGSHLSTLKVAAELSEIQLSIHDLAPVDFIEVYSERGVRLLLLEVARAYSSRIEQQISIPLSDGRTLELCFKHTIPYPSLRVVYSDPLWRMAESDNLNWEVFGDLSPLQVRKLGETGQIGEMRPDPSDLTNSVPTRSEGPVMRPGEAVQTPGQTLPRTSPGQTLNQTLNLIGRVCRRLGTLKLWPRSSGSLTIKTAPDDCEAEAQVLLPPVPPPDDRSAHQKMPDLFTSIYGNGLIRGPLWLRLSAITAIVSALLIATLLFVHPRVTTVTAAELLQRAGLAEEAAAQQPGQVLHRVLYLEEKTPADGKVVSRRQIQIWHDGRTGTRARRLYDEQHQLIAGEWIKRQGTVEEPTVYRRGRPPVIGSANGNQEIWQLELSARTFATLIGQTEAASVREQANFYVLSYEQSAPQSVRLSGIRVLKATLTLRRTDLHAVEQTLLVSLEGDQVPTGTQNPQLREFRFSEGSVDRRQVEAVPPDSFKPDPELLGLNAPNHLPLRIEAAQLADTAKSLQTTLSTAELAALEVEVLHLLDQAGGNLGEQVKITPSPEGTLRVDVLVDTDQRKGELQRALQPVASRPSIKVSVRTFAEALAQQKPESPKRVEVENVEVSSNQIPVYQELRRHFVTLNRPATKEADLEAAINRFADQILDRSHQAMRHAWALKRFSQRFSPEEIEALRPEAKSKLLAMVSEHARQFARNTEIIRGDLEPIFFTTLIRQSEKEESPEMEPAGETGAITSGASLLPALERLFELASAQNQVIQSSFALSPENAITADVKAPQFWRSLRRAERLAARIQAANQPGSKKTAK